MVRVVARYIERERVLPIGGNVAAIPDWACARVVYSIQVSPAHRRTLRYHHWVRVVGEIDDSHILQSRITRRTGRRRSNGWSMRYTGTLTKGQQHIECEARHIA